MRYVIAILLGMFLSTEVCAYDLTWQYTPGTVAHDGFRVFRKAPAETTFTLLQQLVDPAARTFNDPVRVVGTCYRLTAYNAIGDSLPVEACANAPDGSITVMIVK